MTVKVKIFRDVNNKKDLIGMYKLFLILEKFEPTTYCLGVFEINGKMLQYYFDLNDIILQEEGNNETKDILSQ
jgi:hypothetical protein